MESPFPMKPGSTRSHVRCMECQAQKQRCKPINRNWKDKREKCDRCKKLGLPCGRNLTAKEHRSSIAVKAHSQALSPKHQQNADTIERISYPGLPFPEALGISSKLSSNATSDYDPSLRRDLTDISSSSDCSQASTEYDGTVSEEFSRMGFANSPPKRPQTNEIELFEMLRTLGLQIEVWLYVKNIPQESRDEDQGPWLLPLAMEEKRIYNKINSIVDKVEAFGDRANCNGSLCQAETAYSRLIDKMRQMKNHRRVDSLLLKLAKFNIKIHDDVQAKETMRMISAEGQVAPDIRNELIAMQLESYIRSSERITDLFRGSEHFGNMNRRDSELRIENPCPAFHRAIQDGACAETLSKLRSLQSHVDNIDIYRRNSLHVAIEANDVDLIDEIVKDNSAIVKERDYFGRTPLNLAVQHPCEHQTSSACTPMITCLRASVCKTLINAGANRNARDAAGCTTLIAAARKGCSNVVEQLLIKRNDNRPADVHAHSSSTQTTALQAAAEEGHDDIVGMLLSCDAKAFYARADGERAHDLAFAKGHIALANRLRGHADNEEACNLFTWDHSSDIPL